jgi:hypothetical protein
MPYVKRRTKTAWLWYATLLVVIGMLMLWLSGGLGI